MFKVIKALFCIVLSALWVPSSFANPNGYADIVEGVINSVVTIKSTKVSELSPRESLQMRQFEDLFEMFGLNRDRMFSIDPSPKKSVSIASGFIVSPDGLVVTNSHVVDGATEIEITTHSGETYSAKILGSDDKSDLATLKITGTKDVFAFAEFGNSASARLGDRVIAIGNPFGLGSTVTSGIISAKSRQINSEVYAEYLQTDAPINIGNSGGPLFNLLGKVIGINTAIYTPSGGNVGIGFAIPSNAALPIIKTLEQGKEIERGWLGVGISPITKKVAESVSYKEKTKGKFYGAFVSRVYEDSPADKAGLKEMDIILEYNGTVLTKESELPRLVAATQPGTPAKFKVWRFGKVITLKTTIRKLTDASFSDKVGVDPTAEETDVYGIRVASYSKNGVSGVQVSKVLNRLVKSQRILQEGDVITHIRNDPVTDAKSFAKIMKKYVKSSTRYVSIRIVRFGANTYSQIAVPLEVEGIEDGVK